MSSVDRCENDRVALLRKRPAPKLSTGDRWEQYIWRKYRLTPDQVAEMWGMQDGHCAICPNDLTEKKWVIDHDHKSGVVRGLICFFCNWKVLGILERAGRQRVLSACRYLGWS
jgi:recombination endonuclease VII